MSYYNNIKELLINNEITKRVKNNSINKSDLDTYYRIGKELKEAGKHYGEGIVKEYSKRLSIDLGKKYSETTLKYMRLFYDFSIRHSLSDKLSYTHYRIMFSIKDENEVNYYINKAINNNLTVRELKELIKSNAYNRLPKETKDKLINNQSLDITDNIKDSILINTDLDKDKISEKYLHDTIVENISDFMKQLGDGYSFIDSEYSIRIGDTYNYIDILLFNYIYNCFIVVELKVTELKKEHIGQIQVYMNYINDHIKNNNHDKTIGLIIVKENNQYIIKYSSDKRIKSVEWNTI